MGRPLVGSARLPLLGENPTIAVGVAGEAEAVSVSQAGLHCSTVSSRSPTFIPPTLDTPPGTT